MLDNFDTMLQCEDLGILSVIDFNDQFEDPRYSYEEGDI
jgi:hypothetical protein